MTAKTLKRHQKCKKTSAGIILHVASINKSNYRPVSNLSFVSKALERAIAIQLNEYLNINDLLLCYQSASIQYSHAACLV